MELFNTYVEAAGLLSLLTNKFTVSFYVGVEIYNFDGYNREQWKNRYCKDINKTPRGYIYDAATQYIW